MTIDCSGSTQNEYHPIMVPIIRPWFFGAVLALATISGCGQPSSDTGVGGESGHESGSPREPTPPPLPPERILPAASQAPSVGEEIELVPESVQPRTGLTVWNPDGSALADVRIDGVIELRDPVSGRPRASLRGQGLPITSIAFDHEGRLFASASLDGTIRVWDLSTGELRATLDQADGAIATVAFHPKGRALAAASLQGSTWIWAGPELSFLAKLGRQEPLEPIKGWSPGEMLVERFNPAPSYTIIHQRPAALAWSRDGHTLVTIEIALEEGQPDRLTLRDGASLERHAEVVVELSQNFHPFALSPDGSKLITGSGGMAEIWEASTGRRIGSLKGHDGDIRAIAFSPKVKLFAAVDDTSVKLWNLTTGVLYKSIAWESDPHEIVTLGFSDAGDMLAVGSQRRVAVFDGRTGAERVQVPDCFRTGVTQSFRPFGTELLSDCGGGIVAWDLNGEPRMRRIGWTEEDIFFVGPHPFSPDGRLLALSSLIGTVGIWDGRSGRLERTLEASLGTSPVVSFSADGRLLNVFGDQGAVHTWDVTSWTTVPTPEGSREPTFDRRSPPPGEGLEEATSHDGRLRASWRDDGALEVREVATSKVVTTLVGQAGKVCRLAWSPDDRDLLSLGAGGQLRLWKVDKRSSRVISDEADCDSRLTWSADGRAFWNDAVIWDGRTGARRTKLSGCDHLPMNWNPEGQTFVSQLRDLPPTLRDGETGELITVLHPETRAMTAAAIAPNGALLAMGDSDGGLALWELTTGRLVMKRRDLVRPVDWLAFSPDGATLAVGQYIEISLWDTRSGRRRASLPGHLDFVAEPTFSPDGRTLTTDDGHALRLWDVGRAKVRTSLPSAFGRMAVAFSPDGALLASFLAHGRLSQRTGAVTLQDARTGALRAELDAPPEEGFGQAYVTVIGWSTDGKSLAVARRARDSAKTAYTVHLWDVESREARQLLRGHSEPIRSLAFSPDGAALATASEDGTVRLWDVASGEARATLDGQPGALSFVSWSPDGSKLMTADGEGTLRLWGGEPLELERSWRLFGDRVAVSWPGKRPLAMAWGDREVQLVRLSDGEALWLRTFVSHGQDLVLAHTDDGLINGEDNAMEAVSFRRGRDRRQGRVIPGRDLPERFRHPDLLVDFLTGRALTPRD